MNKSKKKICLITGSRADYYLQKNLISNLKKSKKYNLSLIVTGQHLSEIYGKTKNEVYKDFGSICHSIDINLKKTNSSSLLNSIGVGIKKFDKYFNRNKPDLVILLGDRYEMLPVGVSAIFQNLKIAHIHGGEVTSGSIDDTIRHTLTKFSDYHFVSTNTYAKRIIRMGEDPQNVFDVGSLGAENLKKIILIKKYELEKKLSIKFSKYNFLITINSFVENKISMQVFLKNFFKSLKEFKQTSFIFTFPNSDLRSDLIRKQIKNFTSKNKNSYAFNSLGSINYISTMRYCDLVLGNSSSGILETPSLKKPTVNIGDRQKGRIQSKNIINSGYTTQEITHSINKSLSTKFKQSIKKIKNPYYKKDTTLNIIKIIEKKILKKSKEIKSFYDFKKK